jgi:hypothetical protein
MPVGLMMWFCRVSLRMLKTIYCYATRSTEQIDFGLEREFNDLMAELNDHLWPPDGKPPAGYED